MAPAVLHDPVLVLAARGALGALFAAAAFHKLRDRESFRRTLASYRLVPAVLVPAVALGVAALELAVALALLVEPGAVAAGAAGLGSGPTGGSGATAARVAALAGSLGALLLLGVYSGAIAINLARGRHAIDCGCLGPGVHQPLSAWLLARNAVAGAGALATLLPTAPRALVWIDALTLAGALGVLALLWSAANHLLAAWPGLRPAETRS